MVDILTAIQPIAVQRPGQPSLAAPEAAPSLHRHTGEQPEDSRLRAESKRFEAAFLAEMLRHSGFGRMPESFNGGAGEAAFAGTLVQEYANRIAATGTLRIADRIYEALVDRASK